MYKNSLKPNQKKMTAESPGAYAKPQILIKHICTWRSKFRYRSQVKLDACGDARARTTAGPKFKSPYAYATASKVERALSPNKIFSNAFFFFSSTSIVARAMGFYPRARLNFCSDKRAHFTALDPRDPQISTPCFPCSILGYFADLVFFPKTTPGWFGDLFTRFRRPLFGSLLFIKIMKLVAPRAARSSRT